MNYGFRRASNVLGNEIDVMIISPRGCHTLFTARLCFDYNNNMTEYEACIMSIRAAIELRIKFLNVYGDSDLVINKIMGRMGY